MKSIAEKRLHNSTRKKKPSKNVISETRALDLMALPALVLVFLFSYMPMFGVVIAFKKFNPNLGIFGSEWNGFENFKYFFKSQDAFTVTRNTVLYGLTFQITGIVAAVILALLLYEVKTKIACKIYQTIYILPNFLSWVLVAYIAYSIFNPVMGVANKALALFGKEGKDWYSKPGYWPAIFIIFNTWKHVGMNSIIYYAALMGIDDSLFEAARIDGANKLHEIFYIVLPELVSVVIIIFTLGMGTIIKGDFGLFYQLPKDIGVLYPATDVIDTYIYRGLQGSNMGVTSAVGLFQSVVGLFLTVFTNAIVKRIDCEKSLF